MSAPQSDLPKLRSSTRPPWRTTSRYVSGLHLSALHLSALGREPAFTSSQRFAQVMYEMIRRDKNHPRVVMWNVANEPRSDMHVAYNYFKCGVLLALAHSARADAPS